MEAINPTQCGHREVKRVLQACLFFLFLSSAAGHAQSNHFVTVAPEPSYYAWWLRAQFHPFETQVRGIPLGEIHANWCKATEFREDLFPPDFAPDFAQNDASFSVDGNFDGSKTRQTALIGVYETCSGERGSFLMVIARPQGKSAAIRFLHEMPAVQFGILKALPDSTIQVFHCMDCDNVTAFRWNRSKKRFLRVETPEG